MSSDHPLIGQTLDQYKLVELIDQGTFGWVFKAEHLRLHSFAAIKILKTALSDKELGEFEEEAVRVASLQHPNIIRILDFSFWNNVPFLIMPYAPEGSLRKKYPKESILPLKTIVGYVQQIAGALQYAHDNKIIHRDVKPHNCLLGDRGEILLSDFGIAIKAHSEISRSPQDGRGTLAYMSPEQGQKQAVVASDQYSLGVVVYEWLCGKLPFVADTDWEVIRKHREEPPPPLQGVLPGVEWVVMRALAKDPSRRFNTVREFAQQLALAAGEEPPPPLPGVPPDVKGVVIGAPAEDPSERFNSGREFAPQLPFAAGEKEKKQESQPVQSEVVGRQGAVVPGRNAGGSVGQAPQVPPKQQPPSKNTVKRLYVLLAVMLAVILVGGSLVFYVLPHLKTISTDVPTATVSTVINGIGVTTVNGEPIGISDGSFAFDTNRTDDDGKFKIQAADSFKHGEVAKAVSLWNAAVEQDSNDAEALIYLENQRIINSPHVTFVVATMLSGDNATVDVGRGDLQGAYVAQKEFDDNSKLLGGEKVRLLIANAGSQEGYATQVAQQIVQLAHSDHTVVGVMGWPFTAYTYNALQILGKEHIPMVSQTASGDSLSGSLPYFFRVAPTNKSQGIAGAKYAEKLHASKVALFFDTANDYSNSLANDFKQQFTADGYSIVAKEAYTVGKPGATLPGALQDALKHNPDLIYFSGYASDVGTLLTGLASSGASSNLFVLGGDGLYDLGGYPSTLRPFLNRLHFTTFFYHDEWEVQGLGNSPKKPPFFTEYSSDFDPQRQHVNSPLGYRLPTNGAALSYDAMLALFEAYNLAVKSGKTVTAEDIAGALAQIHGANAFQGVSGQISFDSNGDPTNKAIVDLYFDAKGYTQMEPEVQGVFLVS